MTYPSPEEIEREKNQSDEEPPEWFKAVGICIALVIGALLFMVVAGLLGLAVKEIWEAVLS